MLAFLCIAALAAVIPALADTPLDNTRDVTVWSGNPDGGHPPVMSADTVHTQHGPAMRLKYTDLEPHWGNITSACQIPKDARALRFWVYKTAAKSSAAMHIWMFEPDGDAWLMQVPFGQKALDTAPVGWCEVRMPIAGFSFEARGKNTREMTSVNRILIGCNYADLDVSVAAMTWETGTPGKPLPLPKTDGLKVEAGRFGSIGILDMGDAATAHPPAKLAPVLRAAGFGVTVLKAGDLVDASLMTPAKLDAIVLPFGPLFPLEAKPAFLAYLKAGGNFLATDGFAFDRLVILTEGGWSAMGPERTVADMDKPGAAPTTMNARFGVQGDAMNFSPEQIPVFDPQFPLEHATQFRPAAGVVAPEYTFAEAVEGFSAVGLIGDNNPVFPPVYRRYVPVLEAFDREGGAIRGAALGIMHNYAGAFPKSSWAFSGLTSKTDLFLGDAKRQALLVRTLLDITQKVFVHDLKSDLACYETGETAQISAKVANNGGQVATRTLVLTVAGKETLRKPLELKPGETVNIEAAVPVSAATGDYTPVIARLYEGQRLSDTLETAFCKRSLAVLAQGPKLKWEGNYFTVDGRAAFMVGSNQTGMMFASTHEDPLTWERDFRLMGEHNFHILRILHFSPFAKDNTRDAMDLLSRPEKLVRQMDAIVQLAQKHRVAIFLSLHDWMPVELTDEQLKAQADWDRFWAGHFKDVPGVFYDIQNEPGVGVPDRPDIVAHWNRYLADKYGTDEALAAAWWKHPPEAKLPNVPLGGTTEDWSDVRSADHKRFEAEILNHWIKANADGIKAGNPNAACCVGYLPWMAPADKMLGVKYTDFSNMHYYGGTERMHLELKMIDRGFEGKGSSLGECGAEEAHSARNTGSLDVPTEASVQRFQHYVHYGFGLGAAFTNNWCWKDFDESEFPWGLMTRGTNTTKPWLHTWEQEALLLSLAEPKYESPALFVLAPDSNRIGPHFDQMQGAVMRAIDLLLNRRVSFGMINEESLDKLPASAKAIVWPIPYCPTDETFNRVLAWVKAGGKLYLSGDIQFDRDRKPTRADRRKALGLPATVPSEPFATPEASWGKPAIETTVGKGKVLFAPYPLELRGQGSDDALYTRFVALAGLSPMRIEPADAPVRVLSVATRDGGRIFTLIRTSEGAAPLAVTLPEAKVTVELVGHGFAFVSIGPKGEVRAAESQGAITVDGRVLAKADGHFGIGALDGGDLRTSAQVVVFPHRCLTVDVAGLTAGQTAGLGAGRKLVAWVGLPAATQAKPGGAASPKSLTFAAGTTGQVALIAPTDRLEAARAALQRFRELRFAK